MKSVNLKLQEQLNKMCETGKLFRSSVSTRDIWQLYLNGFGNDPMFRDPESSVHNCNLCNNFIRRYGNIVAINESGALISMFDVDVDEEYANSFSLMNQALITSTIQDVFFETFSELNSLPYESCTKNNTVFRLGIDKNVKRYTKEEAEKFGVVKPNEIRTFNHLHVDLHAQFVDKSGKSLEQVTAFYRDKYSVFKRAMEEIPLDTLHLVRDLITQGSLLDGTAHLPIIEAFISIWNKPITLGADKNNWYWTTSYELDERVAKFKNTLIGVLCTELAEGVELNKACLNWNKRVDPANYMKAVAPITKRQIEEAKKFVEEQGYEESFDRRFATIDDIKASEILHVSVGKGDIKKVSIFDDVKSTSTRHKRSEFDKVEEVNIDKFMSDILPTCTSVEAFLTSQHESNLVSLTTANVKESKPIFKWDNNYSWTFNGNLAGKSQIKEAVKTKGGKVDGVLRFSIMWAEGDSSDNSDLDAWCSQPQGRNIGFASKTGHASGGNLDVDIQQPRAYNNKDIVENITFPSLSRMKDGVYRFWVNQYSNRGSKGFKAEVEFNGELYSYEYNMPVNGNVDVAEVTLRNGEFTIKHKLPCSEGMGAQKEIYGLTTNEFRKVNLICLSPNHWSNNNVGNKHYFFMLEGCKCPTSIRSFHAENLIPELANHRKVLEVLGNTTMIEPTDKQLSGLGFNATVKDELVVRLQGTHKRVIKIKF